MFDLKMEKDLKYYLVFLSMVFFMQFVYQVIFPISYLPLSIPEKLPMEYVGTAGLYLGYGAIALVSLSLSTRIKSMLLLFATDVLSPILSHSVEITLLGIATSSIVIVESFLRQRQVKGILLLPILVMALLSMISAFTIDLLSFTFNPSYSFMFLISSLSFVLYTVLWGKNNKRSILKYLASIPALFLFLPLYFMVEDNRFMFMIMDMTFSAIYGISFNNPDNLGLFILLLSLSTYLSVVIALKGNPTAGLGYFIVISGVFMGITGYHLIEYMLLVAVGFSLITLKSDGKENDVEKKTVKKEETPASNT